MESKRLERFAKVMMLTTSTNDGEALAAIRKANLIMGEEGLRWDDWLTDLMNGAIAGSVSQETQEAPAPDWEDVSENQSWRITQDGANWIEALIERALSPMGRLIISRGAEKFLEGYARKIEEWGAETFISEKQWAWMKTINQTLHRRGV